LADRVLTGDTLLIRGSGRTDFQNGDADAAWDSLQRLLALPEETLVYPGHDYKGQTVTTIGEERRHNPRLKAGSREAYVALMGALDLARPKRIETALPANRRLGREPPAP
jgi:glyoxylase-like metal-dependent hydrolase (beta-lactamase superfamily II)